VETTRPANRVHKSALVTVVIGHAQRVGETVVEFLEALSQCGVEAVVERERAIEVVVCVIESEFQILGESSGVPFRPVTVCRERVECWR
jgi:hypothetical protein